MEGIKTITVRTIPLRTDSDFDGVPNWRDCNPWNPYEQGAIHDRLKTWKEKREQTKIAKAEEYVKGLDVRASMTYLIVKLKDGGWENWGAYTRDSAGNESNRIRALPYVEKVIVSDDQNAADKLNRRIMVKQAVGAVKTVAKGVKGAVGAFAEPAKQYAAERQFGENIREGLKTKPIGFERSFGVTDYYVRPRPTRIIRTRPVIPPQQVYQPYQSNVRRVPAVEELPLYENEIGGKTPIRESVSSMYNRTQPKTYTAFKPIFATM